MQGFFGIGKRRPAPKVAPLAHTHLPQDIIGFPAQMIELQQRVERMEARQRLYKMHDPGCEAGEVQRRQQESSMWGGAVIGFYRQPCTCWLKEEADGQ